MARAWLDAAEDLGIRARHPFTFTTKSGVAATTSGVYLPDFGAPAGALLLCRFDPDELYELVADTDFFESALNPHSYEPYRRDLYVVRSTTGAGLAIDRVNRLGSEERIGDMAVHNQSLHLTAALGRQRSRR